MHANKQLRPPLDIRANQAHRPPQDGWGGREEFSGEEGSESDGKVGGEGRRTVGEQRGPRKAGPQRLCVQVL